jgi:hypothetical protein
VPSPGGARIASSRPRRAAPSKQRGAPKPETIFTFRRPPTSILAQTRSR